MTEPYDYLSEFIVAEITSTVRNIAAEVPLGDEGLPRQYVANCDNLRMVPKASLTQRAGCLHRDRWVEVKRSAGAN